MGAPLPARIQPGSIDHVPFPTVGTCLGASLALREKARRVAWSESVAGASTGLSKAEQMVDNPLTLYVYMFGRLNAVWLAEADNLSILAARAAERSLCSRIRLRFRGWDSFTCIPASTTKSSGLNAPTTAVQPFLRALSLSFSQRRLAGSSFPLTRKVANSLVLRAAYANSSSDTNSEAIVKEAIISGGSQMIVWTEASLSADSSSDHAAPDLVIERTPTLIDSGALLLQSLLIDNQEKKRRSTYSTTAFRRSNEEKNFSVRREAECSVIEAEDKEKGEREAILIVLVPPKGSVLDLVVKNLTETIFFALRNRSNNSGLRASTTIGYLTLGESGREGAASRRRHPLRFAKESCGAVKGSRWGSRLSWSPPTCGRGGELILRCQGARRRPQVEATDALVIPVDSLLPVRACCHAGKSGAFGGLFLISKVARGRKMRIQSRRSGRMVEESMDSLGIDSRWLDIRVTTGREEERSTTELLATSCKGKDKTTFRTFLLVQTFE
ncbi:hypothetical protein Tco_1410027 [Tanacetum coccineum]